MLAHEVEDLLERPALLGQGAGEMGSALPDLSENRPLEKLLAVLGDSVGGEPAEPADFVGREVEGGFVQGAIESPSRFSLSAVSFQPDLRRQ